MAAPIPSTGKILTLPQDEICTVSRKAERKVEIGALRPWAAYDVVSQVGPILFQVVYAVSPQAPAGSTERNTGLHIHDAVAHSVYALSGESTFTCDGVVVPYVAGGIINQLPGTVHEQRNATGSELSLDGSLHTPQAFSAALQGKLKQGPFVFGELFVREPAHVDLIAPQNVQEPDSRTAWKHDYFAKGSFRAQNAGDADAAHQPVAGHPGLEVRSAHMRAASGGIYESWVLRPASAESSGKAEVSIPENERGLYINYVVKGSAQFLHKDGTLMSLQTGDCLTTSQGVAGLPQNLSADAEILRIFVSAAELETRRDRTPAERKALETLGAQIVLGKEVRPQGDARPVNYLAPAA